MKAAIIPSAAALAALVLLAPLAVLVASMAPAAWIALPVVGIAVLLLVVVDGLLAGRLVDVRLTLPADAEIGQPATITVLADIARPLAGGAPQVSIGFDPRLGDSGVAELALAPSTEPGTWHGRVEIVPRRRGTGALDGLWLRWPGPMRLAHRQHRRDLDQTLRVWPDLSPVRSRELQVLLRDSLFGLIARRVSGEGTQFEALAEFEPGMDRRRIDWKASARHTRLYARENEAERDNQIVFAFDCGQAMCEDLDGLPRIDRAVTAALTASYVALKGGDKVALYGFAERPQLLTPFVADTRAFHRLQAAAASFDYSAREANFTLALASLAARMKRRSLIVLFSDFADPTSAELMIESVERLVRHHLLIFVTMEDAELAGLASAPPAGIADMASAVAADALAQQRALVLGRLRRLGVDVIEAPWDAIGYRLIDRYLSAKRKEAIG